MRGRFISLLLILAVLFGGAIAPAIAHAQGGSDVHVSEILDLHEADATTGDDQQKPASGMPGETATHHHCTVGLTTTGPDVCLVADANQKAFQQATANLLAAYAQAPPTQPPSA